MENHDSNVQYLYLEFWGRGILSFPLPHALRLFEGSCVKPTSIHRSLNHGKIQKKPYSCAAEPKAVVNRNEDGWDPFLPSRRGRRGAALPQQSPLQTLVQAQPLTLRGLPCPAGLPFSNGAQAVREGTSIRTSVLHPPLKIVLGYIIPKSVISF